MTEDFGNNWKSIYLNIPESNSATACVSLASKSFILEFTQTSCYASAKIHCREHTPYEYSDR
jgi:hypothetical protein